MRRMILGVTTAAGLASGALAGDLAMLPTLGGSWSFAYDINNAGQIVGEADLAGDGVTHAVLWQGGAAADLGAISGNSVAFAINAGGQVAGTSDSGAVQTAMLWSAGSWTDLGADMSASGNSVAWDINDAGLVAGQASISPGFAKGFVWAGPGTGQTQGTVPGYQGGANKGVNSAGVVVGHGFFFGDPDMAMMGVPDGRGGWDESEIGPVGYFFSMAHAVSDAGTIVGLANDGNGPWNAAVFTLDRDNPVMSLGTLPELENSEAYDINEGGVIVGSAWDNDFLLEPRAWVWFGGAMHDLNGFLDAGQTDWQQLLSAEGINDQGDIVGYGLTTSGQLRGFVMTGVVPPACRTDLDGDGDSDTQDFLAYLNLWASGDGRADWDGDGAVNTIDFLAFLGEWASCR